MSIAFVFPGQGSQHPGMGAALAERFPVARDVLCEVDDALGFHLSALMRDGPQDRLTLTENAQPALMAASMAAVRVLETEYGVSVAAAKAVAGHSLGEYSALAAAGAITLRDAARLLHLRGRAMQDATPLGMGAMAAILGLELTTVRSVAAQAAQGEICETANDNAPGQVVLSGHKNAIARAVALAKEQGARRAVLLPVSAPFHCRLMAPAAQVMTEALAQTAITPPCVPVWANVTAQPVTGAEEIRSLLTAQVTGVVRWRESVAAMAAYGVTLFCEVGAGRVLSGLTRRIAPQALAISVTEPGDFPGAIAKFTADAA